MNDILQEVIDQEKSEKINNIFKKIALLIISIGILSIIIALFLSWREKQHITAATKDSDTIMETLQKINWEDKKSLEKAMDKLNKVAEKDASAYAIFARLYIAMIESLKLNHTRSIIEYNKIANNPKYDSTIRQFIEFSALSGELKNDLITPEEGIKKLQQMTQNEKPFRGSSSLLKAVLLAKTGNLEEAINVLNQIINDKEIKVEQITNIANKMKIYFISQNKQK